MEMVLNGNLSLTNPSHQKLLQITQPNWEQIHYMIVISQQM